MSNLAVATPTSPHVRRHTLLSLGVGIAGAVLAIAATPAAPSEPAMVVEIAPPALHDEPRAAAITEAMRDDAAPPLLPPTAALATVTVGGQTYVKLADIAAPVDPDEAYEPDEETGIDAMVMPKHGKLRGVGLEAYSGSALATVARTNVPAFEGWQGRKLVVGTSCRATVTGFAVLATVVGDPFYVGTGDWDGEGEAPPWTAKDVYEHGTRMLVATLSTKCEGRFAREVPAPRAVAMTELAASTDQLAAVRAALVTSAVGRQLHDAWAESGTKQDWDADPEVTFTTKLYRHGATGKVFASVHAATAFSCGANEANIWGLYQLEGGALVPVTERGLEGISEILEIVDVDADGTPDVIGKGQLGLGTEIQLSNGQVLDGVTVPYLGCPC